MPASTKAADSKGLLPAGDVPAGEEAKPEVRAKAADGRARRAKAYAGLPVVTGPPATLRAGMRQYTLDVHVDNYIGHPYWASRERLINITKESGMSRARSDANRRKALEEYLSANGLTYADFERLEEEADRPFYTSESGEIIVPDLHVISMIVAACDQARAAQKPVPADQVRSAITVSGWPTGRKEPDGLWERFAVVTAGTGAKLSNQRALRQNPFIKDFRCTGLIAMNETLVSPDKMRKLLEYAGANVGIGASRKMGWGRFQVIGMDEKPGDLAAVTAPAPPVPAPTFPPTPRHRYADACG
jgi:hypothetical protein